VSVSSFGPACTFASYCASWLAQDPGAYRGFDDNRESVSVTEAKVVTLSAMCIE